MTSKVSGMNAISENIFILHGILGVGMPPQAQDSHKEDE